MIDIVTHCYATQLPQYAVFLHYQLSSLVLHRPDVPVKISVCYSPEDDVRTVKVLAWFLTHTKPADLCLRMVPLDREEMSRRAIGRNRAVDNCQADLVWFTDVDHVFGPGCLDTLWKDYQALSYEPAMLYPPDVLIHKDHATGDALIEDVPLDGLRDVDPNDFIPKHYTRAIGGVQIVSRKFIEQFGYLKHFRRWQRPTESGEPFADFRDDVIFRRQCRNHGGIQKIQLPNLYRLRHSRTTYQGR